MLGKKDTNPLSVLTTKTMENRKKASQTHC